MHTDIDIEVLAVGLERLLSENRDSPLSNVCKKFKNDKPEDWSKKNVSTLIYELSGALLQPSCTLEVATRFPQLVIPFLSLSLDGLKHKEVSHKRKCVALGKLVTVHPDALRCAVKFFENNGAPWKDTVDTSTPAKKRKKDDNISDLEITLTCLNFLKASASHFRSIWKWSSFIKKFINHECFKVRWAACRCITMVICMDEAQYSSLIIKTVTPEELEFCLLEFSHSTDYNNLITEVIDKTAGDSDVKVVTSKKGITQLFPSVVTVSGITLPVFDIEKQIAEGPLVLVQSTVSNLRNAALGVACGKAVCLMGPVGCGKTAIVEHLADVTGRISPPYLMKVQLGDETDAKMLLGSYRCTDVPGEFIWQPGVLTQAVLGGHWLLLEDIDSAPSDVVAVLACLLETGTISVPGFKDNLTPTPGFQIFFTYRLFSNVSGNYQLHSTASELLEKNWLQVNVEPLSKNELIHIVQVKFPALRTIAAKMVSLYLMFSSGDHEELPEVVKRVSKSGRQISTRDLMKWCSRAEMGFDVSSTDSALKVLQDAIDIFCCSVSDGETRMELARKIAACLGIIQTKADFFCTSYKPNVNLMGSKCIAGRIVLPVLESDLLTFRRQGQTKFALTRPASCLVERIAVCLSLKEPVLLVGETGTGKTSTLQLLAHHTGHKLVVLNMNQQSDSTDLLGGFKPVDMKQVISPIRDEFEVLFRGYFSVQQNLKFLEHISTCFIRKRWDVLLRLMKHSQTSAVKRLAQEIGAESQSKLAKWRALGEKINKLGIQLKQGQMALAFTFIEGTLVRALKEGQWVLLDEINLASAEALQCLSGLLEGGSGSLSLLERGDTANMPRHPEFRLMAAMNPATDVGKKDLPPGIRNRFTELFVDELADRTDLCLLVSCYLQDLQPSKVDAVVKFYLAARSEAEKSLCDASGHKPHYSLRTLCRALAVAARNPCGNMQRSLHSALSLSFLTQLDTRSHQIIQSMITRAVIEKSSDIQSVLKQPIPEPSPRGSHVCVEGYWVAKGKLQPTVPEKYILTACVRRNLQDLVRSVSLSLYPILLQGDTCVGKTSLITFLAQATGNKCVRINNHEHTDLQEYIGSYCADPSTGNLVFREGVLVEAMRQGHWIILDELNLAPTDVLEALNRVLDDNRELYIPETQQTIKANPHFRLFATQNPPGLYGGRKVLSRAFRNRFIELHFNEIPGPELEIILQHRCDMPPSYSKKLVAVMSDLQTRRRGSAAFAGKQGFVTLRDLFRWGERYRLANLTTESRFYDWDQHIADEGYLVLAGRVRKAEECEIIRQVIEKHIKRKVDPEKLFTLNSETSPVTKHILEKHVGSPLPSQFKHIFWTFNLRRLAVLIGKADEFKEPVLLVGETGCGKTTVCQLLANNNGQKLLTVNCHEHSESSDFLGGLRPVRDHSQHDDGTTAGRLFEWVDGPLIEAMTEGHVFLADEISLADDSVLERLNSLLEPERTLLLSEKGTAEEQQVVAIGRFRFVGTMNPGGDFGKKELSPALRNRLTEIWCECISDRVDWVSIIEHNVRQGLSLGNQEDATSGIGNAIMDFITWFRTTDIGKRVTVSVRDILMWVQFINTCAVHDSVISEGLDIASAYIHGGCLTLIDSLGAGATGVDKPELLNKMRQTCLEYLINQMETLSILQKESVSYFYNKDNVVKAVSTKDHFGIPPFFIKRGNLAAADKCAFTLGAVTTCMNACRVLRGLQLPGRAILLEGSPGVGKTSLVTALAQAAGYPVTRINLSDQTDVSDLFGADLPVEGAPGGTFAWRDGPLLRALISGHWILLDELNLASQSVLEGLNAVLDHRGEFFVPELGKTFHITANETKLFACQNPLRQGGARRGLPQSFLNRFTQVYIDPLTSADLLFILSVLFPKLPSDLIEGMVRFNERLSKECGISWANKGAPWEMNLRDLTRWAQAMKDSVQPGKFVGIIYADRMRTLQDKQKVFDVYAEEFGKIYPVENRDYGLHVTTTGLLLGDVLLPRINCTQMHKACQSGNKMSSDILTNIVDRNSQLVVLRSQLPALRSLAVCIENNWMAILVGRSGSGKTSVVRLLSQLCGRQLRVLAVNSAMDTTEILGGFEQADHGQHLDQISEQISPLVFAYVQQCLLVSNVNAATDLLSQWEVYTQLTQTGLKSTEVYTLASALELFEKRVAILIQILNRIGSNIYTNKVHNDLKILHSRVQSEHGLNTGGTFEWVDSILVKCLQEGSWLLIDNVNLCSCAVLDRLNALLEPGGILSLGERGVDSEGNVVTIKPHPDFRLFLAMDPRHGEISRAMRNRGVEICLLSPEEKPLHSLDLEALLCETGLTHKNHQRALKNIHNAMVNHEFSFDSPTVNNLLHTATLIVQHWLRGQPLAQSFESCCRNVYIKARHFMLEQKQRAFEVLSEVLKSQHKLLYEHNSQTLHSNLQSDLTTVRTLAIQESSSVAMLKQQGALIGGILKALSSNPREILTLKDLLDNEFADLKGHSLPYIGEVKLSNIVYHVLLSFYSKAAKRDITTRKNWIEFLIKINNHKYSTSVCAVSNSLSKLIIQAFYDDKFSTNTTSSLLNRDELPWDLRRALPWDCSADWSLENKMVLLMHLIVQNQMNSFGQEQTASEKKKIHWENMTISEFSYAFNKGALSELAVNDTAVTEFCPLIASLNECLSVVLTSKLSETLNSEQFDQLLATLHWKHRLAAVGENHLFIESTSPNNLPQVSEHVLTVLKIHYKWLIKWLLPQVLYLTGNEKMLQENEVTLKLLDTVSHLKSSIYNDVSPLLSVAKSVGNIMSKPLPRTSVSQAQATQTVISLQKAMSLFEGITNFLDLQQKLNFIVSAEGKQCRMKLVKAQVLLHEDGLYTDEVSILLKDVEDECLKHNLIKAVYHKKNDQDIAAKKKFLPEVALWPIHEVFFLYLSNAFRNFLASVEEPVPSNEISCNDLLTLMLNWSQNVSSVPPNVVALLHVAKSNIISNKNVTCSFSLLTSLMQQYTVSTPFKNFRLWLYWNNEFTKSSDDDEIMDYELLCGSKEKLSLNTPLLSLFVTSLISQNCDNHGETSSAEITSLSSYEDKKKLVTAVKGMLWRSGPAVTTHYFGNSINEESCIKKLFKKFITSLKISLQAKGYLKELPTETCTGDIDITEPVLNALRLFVDTRKTKQFLNPVTTKKQKDDCVTVLSANVIKLRDLLKKNQSGINQPHELWMSISEAWVLLGFIKLLIFSCIDLVDPVYKTSLKLQYAVEEREYLNHTLIAEELQSIIQNTQDFPFKSLLEDRISNLVKTEEALKKYVAVRPDPQVFTQLYRELAHTTASICSPTSISNLLNNLTSAITNYNQANVDRYLKEAEGWMYSVTRSITNLHNYTSWFPDIVIPIVNSLTEMSYGIHLMSNTVHKLSLTHAYLNDTSSITPLILSVGQFPIPDIETALKMVKEISLSSSLSVIDKAFRLRCKEDVPTSNQSNRLAKCCLHELCNVISVHHSLEGSREMWNMVCCILNFVAASWQKQEEQRKQKEQEEESYFINKVRKPIENLSEEEELELDIAKWFPSQKDADFGDLEGPSLEDKKKAEFVEFPESEKLTAFTNKEMNEICQIHTDIVTQNTRAHWLYRDVKHSANIDFMTTFLERFSLFGTLLESYCEICYNDVDHKVIPALCLATNNFVNIGNENAELHVGRKQYDFYHHSNVSEVKECIPILKTVTTRVIELLAEWPDHPTLNQINVVIERIQNFSITSPVSRFLTGLELLLTKMHEWEENAHSGVSLTMYIATVTSQILKWRKLELACWKGSLESSAKRMREDTSKWWFHLYCLVTSYDKSDSEDMEKEVHNDEQLIIALEHFMESSVLGNFQARLDLLYTFHCHSLNSISPRKEQISTIFWNMYQYYTQFSAIVKSRIYELTSPVEKKLKDYVKIAKWNDINYWSVKGTIEKTHRTLLKYIHEYETVLKQPVTDAMTKLRLPEKQTGELKITPDLYVANIKFKEMLESKKEDESPKLSNTLSRGTSLFLKSRKLCKELIECSGTAGLIYTIDCIADELYDSSQELKNLDVNRTLPKEKQKSEAKSILQRKRKNLSDIFRTLQTMGLSYRAGIIVFSKDTKGFSSFAIIPPLDIEAALGQIEPRASDRELLTAWKGCSEYYFHSIALLAQLQTAMFKPHKDIGPPIIERCKGFTVHLMKLCQDQKKDATDSCQLLYMLRCQIKQLTVSLEDNAEWPKQLPQTLSLTKVKIIDTLDSGQYCLQQFLILLDACPEQETQIAENEALHLTDKLLPDSLMSPAQCAYKYDSVWQEVRSNVNECIKLIGKIKNNLTVHDKSVNFIRNLMNINPRLAGSYTDVSVIAQYSVVVESLESLSDIKNCVAKIMSSFELKLKREEELHPLTECLFIFDSNIDKCLNECKTLFGLKVGQEWTHVMTRSQTAKLTKQVVCDYENTVDSFVNTLLIVIQELYKRNVKTSEKTEDNVENKDQKEMEFENELVENHLKDKVVNNIFSEIKLLKMETVNKEIMSVTTKLSAMVNWDNRKICKGLLRCCVPLLEQYYLLSQYMVTQQIAALKTSAKLCSNLLSIFTDLALKGFRIPEDLLDEGEEGESQTLGGMGLGEGEGEKDVSDQIESQDQLEDAKPAGQEKEEEDKECKEEEKGIEMSDDFGGKLQDVEEKEKENDSDKESEREEEEPDKEMGETDKGADMLDQQIWGSDSEEEKEDEEEKKEEEGDMGEQVGEKEYGPKDTSKELQDDDEDGKNKSEDKKKEINEMDEPNEDDDQVDPYHGKHQPEKEPELFDLPEDLKLDDEQQKDEDQEENPFDIDAMKEPKLPDDQPEDEEVKESQEKEENRNENDSSDEDGEGAGEKETVEDIPETQSDEENADDGGKKDEDKTGEENKPEEGNAENNMDEESTKPSEDTPSMEPTQSSDQDAGSKDQVSHSEDKSLELKPEESAPSEGPDTQGVGTAEQKDEQNMEQGTQGSGATKVAPVKENEVREEKRQRPGESDDQRALGNINEPKRKKLKTIKMENESQQNKDETQEEGIEQETNADIYQHIKEAKDVKYDTQTLDTATDEQAEKQPTLKKEEEEEGDSLEDNKHVPMDEDEVLMETEETPTLAANDTIEFNEEKNKKEEKRRGQAVTDNFDGDTNMEVEGEFIQTSTVGRGSESTIHTHLDKMDGELQKDVDVRELRTKLEEQLASWSQPPLSDEAEEAWDRLCTVTSNLSRDLSEQLRLVLEPTRASRLKGDFRTGRRINMRKVIPYIASQFRKDKIWLRRTKPSKREYQIVLAIDDSSSMADNHSKELAFESLAVVSKALTLLEAGDLCVLSFGEKTKVLHQLGEPFMEQSGARLLQQFSFEQQKTQVGELVNFACTLLSRHGPSRSGSEFAQLLIIVSDGRGVLNEGEAKVAAAVRRAKHQGVFMVFIIIDNPTSKSSILDIRMPKFSGGKLLEISSYMDSFPFPFYLILRDINNLPTVLSDALRQWFELVTSSVQ